MEMDSDLIFLPVQPIKGRLDFSRSDSPDQPVGKVLGFPRCTRSEKPHPFSNGSTVAVTSRTGYRTVANP